ncbi:MAG: hypothetical protein HY314_14485 [Acidobacteria bacterium]|nr:hypothetical protein [Acidobacteriota bacterium]
MSSHVLPEQVKDLEPFSAWALATEAERNLKRLSSPMAEIQAFYHAMLPRMQAIMEYLHQFPLDQMPEEARRLFHLTLSFAEVTPAVELFKQPSVVEGFDPARFVAVHVPNMTPAEI